MKPELQYLTRTQTEALRVMEDWKGNLDRRLISPLNDFEVIWGEGNMTTFNRKMHIGWKMNMEKAFQEAIDAGVPQVFLDFTMLSSITSKEERAEALKASITRKGNMDGMSVAELYVLTVALGLDPNKPL